MADVGQRIRQLRVRLGMTQEALARVAKLTPKFLSQIENGRVNPSIGVLDRIVTDGFGVTMAVFFTWDPEDAEVSRVLALLAQQPGEYRRRVLRVVEVLCDGESKARERGGGK